MAVKVSKPELNLREKISELDKPSGVAGEAMLRAETPQEQFNLIGASRRRINHNGDMRVWQRGTTASNPSTAFAHVYGADRYLIQVQDMGTVTTTIDTDVPPTGGFNSSTKIACTATGTAATGSNLILIHRIEGQDSQCTNFGTNNPEHLTLSFWIKSNKVGSFNVNFENEDTSIITGASSADQGYQTKQHIHSADTWEYKTVTIEGDPYSPFAFNTNKGLCFDIVLSSAGSNYGGTAPKAYWHNLANAERSTHNENYFAASTSNYYKITGVQLELGKVATPFEHRSYGEELALCQRYYYRWEGSVYDFLAPVQLHGSNQYRVVIDVPVALRIAPSITWSGLATWYAAGSLSAGFSAIGNGYLSSTRTNITRVPMAMTPTSTILAAYQTGMLSADNTSNLQYLAFDSEL